MDVKSAPIVVYAPRLTDILIACDRPSPDENVAPMRELRWRSRLCDPTDRRPAAGVVVGVRGQPHVGLEPERQVDLRRRNRVLAPRAVLRGTPSLSVNSHTPAMPSTTHRPKACDTPTSGLTDHRWVPRLISFVESYCPSGGATVRLTPTSVPLAVRREHPGRHGGCAVQIHAESAVSGRPARTGRPPPVRRDTGLPDDHRPRAAPRPRWPIVRRGRMRA